MDFVGRITLPDISMCFTYGFILLYLASSGAIKKLRSRMVMVWWRLDSYPATLKFSTLIYPRYAYWYCMYVSFSRAYFFFFFEFYFYFREPLLLYILNNHIIRWITMNFDLKKENTFKFSQECINMYIGLITIKRLNV